MVYCLGDSRCGLNSCPRDIYVDCRMTVQTYHCNSMWPVVKICDMGNYEKLLAFYLPTYIYHLYIYRRNLELRSKINASASSIVQIIYNCWAIFTLKYFFVNNEVSLLSNFIRVVSSHWNRLIYSNNNLTGTVQRDGRGFESGMYISSIDRSPFKNWMAQHTICLYKRDSSMRFSNSGFFHERIVPRP